STGFLPGMEPMATQGALDLSGIDDARFFHEAEARIVEALRNFAETASLSASVRKRLFAGDAVQGIALIDLVRTQFDVMLMNPPFGELSEAGKEALSRGRARRPLDAYTQFLYRSVELLADGGSVGALVSKTFMTHAEFEPTRRWLLSNAGSLRHFAELGTGVLDAAVEVAAITLAPGAVDATCFFDVTDSISKGDTLRNACESKDNDRLFVRNHAQFLCRPGAPLAYRLSAEVMASIMEESTLADLVDGAWGLFTAADSRFVRAWWEVDPKALGTIWLPFAKGGTPRSFFSEPLLVVRWDANGSEILSRKGDRGQTLARAPNKDKYERPGLTYSSISSSGFRVRPLNEGSIFSIKGPALFPTVTRAHWLPLLDMLNTGEISYLLSTLSSNRSAELNYALRISIPRDWKRYFTGHISKQLFRLQRWFSTGSETSRYFLGFPLDRDQRGPLGTILVSELIQKLNEAGCNAFSKFGFDDEAIARYRPSAQHLSSQPKVDLHSVLSYLVGVAFGRWRSSAIAPCEREEQLSDEFASVPRLPGAALSEMLHVPDMPGVLVDDPGHCADITALVSQYGRVLNAPHVPLEDPDLIRGILRNDFFLAHITSYSEAGRRAPIYWQLSTPSASYSVWLYTHAFSPDTLYKVQNDFIATKLAHEERKLEEMRAEFDRSTPAVRLKEHVTQEAFVDELRTFSVEVKLVAPVWRPTIDDGVVINFAPLWRLVPHQNAWQKELKLAWDKLVDGEEDWAHLAMRLWPERVVPKCANDRSLAIAHGLEDTFWVEADDGKWKPRSIPTRSVEELVRDMTSSSVKAALKKLLEAPVPSAAASRGRGGHRIANTVVNRGAH
ncbi:MAG TPA: hypothetical protein VK638_01640, partial [Edaphobacter sp.]|nr:hypothetical protein [Edaphobacter sp.]